MRWNHWATVTAIVTSIYGCPRTNMCLPGEVMVEGRCAADCPPGATNGCRDTGVPVDAALEAGDAMSCGAGQTRCGAECVDLSSNANHCGRCDMRCSALEAGTAVCSMGSCSSSCGAGTHACNGACVSNDAPTTCGTRCDPCPTPAGARATCVSQMCGIECLPGFERVGDSCEANVPRPIFPPGTSTVTSHRPTFRWELGMGTDGVVVEVCRDRACTMRVAMFDATGTSARPAMALPASTALFWRLRGRVGMVAGSRFSPTWQFRTRATDASVDTAFGTELDFNGDGFSDVAVASARQPGSVQLFFGGTTGLTMSIPIPTPVGETGFGFTISTAGDVDGDGFGDIVIGSANAAFLYSGRPDRSILPPVRIPLGATASGDLNGDGYSDVAVGNPMSPAAPGRSRGSVTIYNGSRTGISAAAGRRVDATPEFDRVGVSVAVGDTNGDGFADVVVSAIAEGARSSSVLRFLGASAGVSAAHDTVVTEAMGGGSLGWRVAASGDINGDGIADIVASAPFARVVSPNIEGLVRTFLGLRMGTPRESTMLAGEIDEGVFGDAIAIVKDTNNDGFDEVLVGAKWANFAMRDLVGSAYLFRGSASGAVATSALTIRGSRAGAQLGMTVASHGDINGDGRGDFGVGAPGSDAMSGTSAGVALVYFGESTPTLHRTVEGAAPNEQLGHSIASRGFSEPRSSHPRSRSPRWCAAR